MALKATHGAKDTRKLVLGPDVSCLIAVSETISAAADARFFQPRDVVAKRWIDEEQAVAAEFAWSGEPPNQPLARRRL